MTRHADMKENIAVVVTTIAEPNDTLRALARGCQERGYQFIAIGDEASPPDFQLDGCSFYGLEEQYESGFRFARLCPTRDRKNYSHPVESPEGSPRRRW